MPQAFKGKERRRGPDPWLKSLIWLTFFGWICLALALLLMDKAMPKMATFFDRWLLLNIRTQWDDKWIQGMLIFIFLGGLLSLTGLLINASRHKRRTDTYSRPLVILSLASISGTVFYLLLHFF